MIPDDGNPLYRICKRMTYSDNIKLVIIKQCTDTKKELDIWRGRIKIEC